LLKNSRLMPRSAHIVVYLVHAVSCRWQTRGTYFPTIPRIKQYIKIVTCVETLDAGLVWRIDLLEIH
jgi:hypothetical protein